MATKKATTTDRRRLALDATGQIEAFVGMLKREHTNEDGASFSEILITSLRRIKELNSVVMSVLEGDDRDVKEMRTVVHGEEAVHG